MTVLDQLRADREGFIRCPWVKWPEPQCETRFREAGKLRSVMRLKPNRLPRPFFLFDLGNIFENMSNLFFALIVRQGRQRSEIRESMLKLMADTAYLLVHFVWKFSQDLIISIVTSQNNMGSETFERGR